MEIAHICTFCVPIPSGLPGTLLSPLQREGSNFPLALASLLVDRLYLFSPTLLPCLSWLRWFAHLYRS